MADRLYNFLSDYVDMNENLLLMILHNLIRCKTTQNQTIQRTLRRASKVFYGERDCIELNKIFT